MKYTFLFSLIALSLSINAQPVITAADLMPVVGTSYAGDSVMYVNVSGFSGPNQTWDLSNVTPIGSPYNYQWVNPNSALGAANFPDANAAITVESVSFFHNIQTDKYEDIGHYLFAEGTELIETFSNPSTRFGLPLSYNSSGTDAYVSTTSIGDLFEINSTGTTTWDVIGHGSLSLPTGTFTEVLLVHVVDSSVDSQSFGGISIETNVLDDVYLFYKAGYPMPLVVFESITITDMFGSQTTQGGLVFSVTNEIPELSNSNKISLFPNPTTDMLTVSFVNIQPYRLDVVSLTGEVVMKTFINEFPKSSIDLSELPAGTYLLRAIGNKGTAIERFIKL